MALISYLSLLVYKAAMFQTCVPNFKSEILLQSSRTEVRNAKYFSQESVTTINLSPVSTCRQVTRAPTFFTVATNFCGPSNWNLLDVKLLAPII